MNKYIQNLSKWGIFFLLLVQCSSREPIVFRSCPGMTQISYCSELEMAMNQKIRENTSQFHLLGKKNSGEEYINLLSLSKKQSDAAILFYDIFRNFPSYEEQMRGLLPSKNSFLVPVLLISQKNFPYNSLSELRGKNWNIGIAKDSLQRDVVTSLLDSYHILYHLVESDAMNFISLMEDGNIDLFACLSTICSEILSKTSHILGGVQALSIPFSKDNHSQNYLTEIHLSSRYIKKQGIIPHNGPIQTLAAKEYLVARDDITEEKKLLLFQIFEKQEMEEFF